MSKKRPYCSWPQNETFFPRSYCFLVAIFIWLVLFTNFIQLRENHRISTMAMHTMLNTSSRVLKNLDQELELIKRIKYRSNIPFENVTNGGELTENVTNGGKLTKNVRKSLKLLEIKGENKIRNGKNEVIEVSNSNDLPWKTRITKKIACLRKHQISMYLYHVRKAAGTTLREILEVASNKWNSNLMETEGISLDSSFLDIPHLLSIISLRHPIQRIVSMYWYVNIIII